jgi:hypothetical protein
MKQPLSRALLAIVRVCFLTILAAAPLYAQRWSDLVPVGARVRVRTQRENEIFVGEFRSSPSDSLNILSRRDRTADSVPIALPHSYVKSVDVSDGHSRGKRGVIGALVGGVVGGFIGALVGGTMGCPPRNPTIQQQCYSEGDENDIAVAILGIVGAGAGVVLGGVTGAASAPENWHNVYTDRGARLSP